MSAWLDNLIPLKAPSRLHRQLAGWQPAAVAEQGLGCHLLADRRVPMQDGVTLSADVYTPKRPGRYPAILQFAAYSRELHTAGVPTGNNEIGCPPIFTNRGYAQVVLERRGMGRSHGEQQVFFSEGDVDDHEAAIAWAAAQPWCDGRVVLFGTSYYGMTQPLVAVRNPPALKAFFCNEICTDYFRQLVQFGGHFGLYFMTLWMGGNFTRTMFDLRMPPVARALISHVTNGPLHGFMQRHVMKLAPMIFKSFMKKTPVLAERDWYARWLFDGKTRDTCTIPPGPSGELGKITVPFVTVQNLAYFNLHQFGSYDLFQNAGTPADRKWMILAPPEYALPVYDWQLEAAAFFDHVLRGTDNGYAGQPPVRYWLDGEDRYVGAADFPPPNSSRMRLFLSSNGADSVTHALTAQPPAGGENRWAAIPLGAPVIGGLDEVMNQTLSYELPVAEDLHLAGAVTAKLQFSCNEIDSQLVARLGRVAADGSYTLLSMGTISPARRHRDPARDTRCEIVLDTGVREPLVPGEPVSLLFSLTPGPTSLRAGEKLRLDIASRTDLLRSDVAHGYVHFDMQVPPYFSRNTLHYGLDTYIEVDRVEAAAAS